MGCQPHLVGRLLADIGAPMHPSASQAMATAGLIVGDT
jgi:hypothetical protein